MFNSSVPKMIMAGVYKLALAEAVVITNIYAIKSNQMLIFIMSNCHSFDLRLYGGCYALTDIYGF